MGISVKNRSNIVIQSNILVEAYYDTDLKATEHKIIRYAASKIKANPNSFPDVSFTVKEFLEAGGIRGDGYYSRFEKIADELSKKRIKIKTDNSVGWIPWLSALVYKNGEVHLTFNHLIKDMLFDLKGQFTKYDYKHIGDMRSAYTIRLYELLKQYASIGRRRVHLDVLRNMLGTEGKHKQYGQFKLRVLNQAKKELDEKKGLTFEFNEIKQGRKVVEIEFIINTVNQKVKTKTNRDNLELETFLTEAGYLLDNNNISIPKERLSAWFKYGIDLLNEVLEGVKKQKNKIHNYPAYIEKSLENKLLESQKKLSDIEASSDEHAKLIVDFIGRSRTNETLPKWMLKRNFSRYMNKHIESEELIDKLWSDNEEKIIDETLLYLKK